MITRAAGSPPLVQRKQWTAQKRRSGLNWLKLEETRDKQKIEASLQWRKKQLKKTLLKMLSRSAKRVLWYCAFFCLWNAEHSHCGKFERKVELNKLEQNYCFIYQQQ